MPKVLIIDYDPRAIKALCDPIEKSGYIVIQSSDGRQGLLDYQAHTPDLVIVEAMIPKRSGFDVCQDIRANDKKTPIIIVSSVYKGRRYRSQAIHQYGATEFMEKPIEATVLLKRVTELAGSVSGIPKPRMPAPAPSAAPANVATSVAVAVDVETDSSVEDEISERLDSLLGS